MEKLIRITTVPSSLKAFSGGLLKDLSNDYKVVAVSSPGLELDEVGRAEGVWTIGVPMERHISLWKDIRSLREMIKVFRREKPDLVHSMTPKAGLISMMAGWWTEVPVRVHTFTGLVWPTSTGLKRWVLKMTDRITCACATHIIPEGEGVKSDLISGHITRKPLRVLGYGNVRGIDLNYYDRTPSVIAAAEVIRETWKFTFVFVGRIVRDKGINELVEAFVRLNEKYPDTRLLLVGRYEDSLDPIGAAARSEIETNDKIEAVGPQSDVRPYYAAADCFVFPSYREGFPNTVIEAGAMGLASIVTDINGSREIIKNGVNGLIIPSKDSAALYNAMEEMLTDDSLRSELSSRARSLVASRFEQGFVRQCLKDFYHEVLK